MAVPSLGADHVPGLARAVDEGVGDIRLGGPSLGPGGADPGRARVVAGVRAGRAGIESGEGRPAACRPRLAEVGLQVGLTVAPGERQLLAGR